MNRKYRDMINDPAIDDRTLLISIEDLISTAFGAPKKNKVNFKLLQTILHILAHQMRLLEQDVSIKFDEIGITEFGLKQDTGYDDGYDDESGSYLSGSAEVEPGERGAERRLYEDENQRRKVQLGKEEKEDKKDRGQNRERSGKDEDGKTSSKDRENRAKDSGDRDDGDKYKKGQESGRRKERGGERGPDERKEQRGDPRADGARDARRQDRGQRNADVQVSRKPSATNITVSEVPRKGPGRRGSADKILVAERGPPPGSRPARVGSIEVVTASKFALLAEAVKKLEQMTKPLPTPVMPDNDTLRQDLAKGRVSLQDTMQAVQLTARVQAAEQGLSRMAELLTELAQSGMLPPEYTDRVGAMEEYLQTVGYAAFDISGPDDFYSPGVPGGRDGPGGPRGHGSLSAPGGPRGHGSLSAPGGSEGRGTRPVQSGGKNTKPGTGPRGVSIDMGRGHSPGGTETTMPRKDTKKPIAAVTVDVAAQSNAGVMSSEMHDVLKQMKDALFKEVNSLTARANRAADMASAMARSTAEKLDTAMQIDGRVNTLFEQIADYSEQINGFDTGITTQVQNFQEQLVSMRNELSGGLALLEASNNNAETAALLDLTDRYEGLIVDLDNTVCLHQNLHVTQHQIGDELRSLIQCVEMLREQKADRDEVLDGLRDKADVSRLAGLLYEKDFAYARYEIEKRLATCYDKFTKQDKKWRDALKELLAISDNKGEFITLMSLKDNTNAEINTIQQKLLDLEILLGVPKAALLMRKLAKDAACGACLTGALMKPEDTTYGKPLSLPPLRPPRPPPLGAELPCLREVTLVPLDIRDHTCHRWVGGSHTVMARNVVKEKAGPIQQPIRPVKKYEERGVDGRLYMMEEDMQPCMECNKLSSAEPERPTTGTGAGDQASAPPNENESEAIGTMIYVDGDGDVDVEVDVDN